MTNRTPHFRGRKLLGVEPRHPWEPPDRPDWFTDHRRACSPLHGRHRLWTSDEQKDLKRAARICRQACPFLPQCRDWAIETGEQHFTWGGFNLSTEEGRKAAKATPKYGRGRPRKVVAA